MKKLKPLYYLSFIIPVAIMMLIFVIQKIYPFGDRSFLHIDMYHQYFPFLVEFYHKVKNGESLLYSWNTGIGTNFVALYAYYLASPFNWLCLLVPEAYLLEFLSYLVIIKIGLCGFTFSYYASKHFGSMSMGILGFSLFYSLSGFMAAYNWDVMWLDVVILAPMVILGLERLVYEGKCRMYCIALGASILSNYYLSIMLCIFLCLYFVVLLISKSPKAIGIKPLKFYVKAIVRFAIYSIMAGGMGAVLLFPEIEALKLSEFSQISFPSKVSTYFSFFDMIARHCFDVEVETGLDHWPNIYCGVAIFLLIPLYVISSKISLREKIPKIILAGFMLISFSTNLLNFIWHGFNYPDSLPARQSFLYIFLVLTMCLDAFMHIKDFNLKEISISAWFSLFLIMLFEKLADDDAFNSTTFVVTGILLIAYTLVLLSIKVYNDRKIASTVSLVLLLITAVFESGVNTFLTSVPTVSRSSYMANYDSYQTLTSRTVENEDGDFFRFEKFARRTQNDAMIVGFQGASYFSSTINASICDFYENYGMRGSKVNYCFEGATPITSALLSVRYMLYTLDRDADTIYQVSDTEGNLYLYDCNYYLPLGYMVTEGFEPTSHYSGYNPIEKQNALVNRLGVDGDVFTRVSFESSGSTASINITEDAHYYAYTTNTSIDNIKLYHNTETKSFSQIKKKYILDLGYYEAGDFVSLNTDNGEDINIEIYKVNEDVLAAFIEKLGANTLDVSDYDETHLNGTIDVDTAGYLVMSIPTDPSWTLYVDENKTEFEEFEDAFISVYLTEGSHTISLQYYPKGLTAGIIVSLISVIVFVIINTKFVRTLRIHTLHKG